MKTISIPLVSQVKPRPVPQGQLEKFDVEVPFQLSSAVQRVMIQPLNQCSKLVLPSLACTFVIALQRGIAVEVYDPIFKKSAQFENGCFIGPHDRTFFLRSLVPSKFIIVVFHPGEFFSSRGAQPPNVYQALTSVCSSEIVSILDQVIATACPTQQVSIIQEYLNVANQKSDRERERNHKTFERLFHYVFYGQRATSVRALCDELKVSQKKAERVFQRYVGMNPKSLLKMKRYMNALYIMSESSRATQFRTIAKSCGYYDLSHMINDFKSLAGCPPSGIDPDKLKHDVLYVEGMWFTSMNQRELSSSVNTRVQTEFN